MLLFQRFLVFLLTLVLKAHCKVSLRPIESSYIGSNVTLYCDLIGELTDNVFWSRTNQNSTSLINFINTNNIPIRYKIKTQQHSLTYTVTTLDIYGLQSEDIATFSCTGSESSRQNLTLGIEKKVAKIPSEQDQSREILSLCHNGSYNSVLYAMLTFSNLILTVIMFCFLKFLKPRQYFDVTVAFGCLLSAATIYGVISIFLMNPSYAAEDESKEYWLPVIVVPQLITVLLILWVGNFYFLLRSFLENKIITTINLVVSTIVAFSQLLLCLTIVNSIVYCTGRSKLPKAMLNYSVISDMCAGLVLLLCLFLCLYFFWTFKEQMQMIGIFTTVEESTHKTHIKVNQFQSGSTDSQISIIPVKCESINGEQVSKLTTQLANGRDLANVEEPFTFVSDVCNAQEFSCQSKLYSRSSPKLDQLVTNMIPVRDFPLLESSRYPMRDKSMVTIKKKGSAKLRRNKKTNELNFLGEIGSTVSKRPRSNLSSGSNSKDSTTKLFN